MLIIQKRQSKGFTLVELLIALAIVGILTSVALPSYRSYSLKSNRTEALSIINEIMQAQERFAADRGQYTDDLGDLGYNNPQLSENSRYSVAAAACDAGGLAVCVILTATAQGGQDQDANGNGGDISLNSRGQKVGWKDG